MIKLYRQGSYDTALKVATELKESVENLVGNDNNIYASALSDQALMYKSIGQYDESVEAYNSALQVYAQTIGIKNDKYVTTLSNKAVVYKVLAEKSADASIKDEMLLKSEETLSEAKNIILELHDNSEWSTTSIQALVCNIHLCGVYMQGGKHSKAIGMARSTLNLMLGEDYKKKPEDDEEAFRDIVRYHANVNRNNRVLLANTYNNLALALKKSVTTITATTAISSSSTSSSNNNNNKYHKYGVPFKSSPKTSKPIFHNTSTTLSTTDADDLELELDNIRQDAYVSMRIELDEQYGDLQYIDKWPGLSPYKESDIIKSKILNC